MDGDVDGVVEKRFFQFLGEEPLAANRSQSPVEDFVAGGLDDDDLEGNLVAVDGRQPVAHLMRLRESKSAPPGANADLPCF